MYMDVYSHIVYLPIFIIKIKYRCTLEDKHHFKHGGSFWDDDKPLLK